MRGVVKGDPEVEVEVDVEGGGKRVAARVLWGRALGLAGSKFGRYCLIGGINLGINTGVTALLHEVAGAPEEVAFAVALVLVFALNFWLSRHYIFQVRDGCARTQFVRFLVSSASFRGVEYLAFLVVHSWLGVYYLAAVVGVQVASFVGKFFFYGRFVFRGGGRGGRS